MVDFSSETSGETFEFGGFEMIGGDSAGIGDGFWGFEDAIIGGRVNRDESLPFDGAGEREEEIAEATVLETIWIERIRR